MNFQKYFKRCFIGGQSEPLPVSLENKTKTKQYSAHWRIGCYSMKLVPRSGDYQVPIETLQYINVTNHKYLIQSVLLRRWVS